MSKLYFILLAFLLVSCDKCDESGCTDINATNYDPSATLSNNCSCKYDGINTSCGEFSPPQLVVAPVQQETEVWCWLAVGEMVFRYYGLPSVNGFGDYQCGIVGALGYS